MKQLSLNQILRNCPILPQRQRDFQHFSTNRLFRPTSPLGTAALEAVSPSASRANNRASIPLRLTPRGAVSVTQIHHLEMNIGGRASSFTDGVRHIASPVRRPTTQTLCSSVHPSPPSHVQNRTTGGTIPPSVPYNRSSCQFPIHSTRQSFVVALFLIRLAPSRNRGRFYEDDLKKTGRMPALPAFS